MYQINRKRKKCEHGNCVYDCALIEKGVVCGKSLCSHQRRKRDCKYCKKEYSKSISIPQADNNIKLEFINLNYEREKIKKLIVEIPTKGCKCGTKKRKFISSIVGCGKLYGCNHDKLKCLICEKTFRYPCFVYNHIKRAHQKIVLV
jgi:hypothetical protein